MSTGETVALGLLVWTLGAIVLALLIATLIPRSPEPDEHEACHGDPEALRAVRQSGVIGHFHTATNLTDQERNHVG